MTAAQPDGPSDRRVKHLAVLSRGLEGGGVQRMMRHVADELARRGFEVDFLVPSHRQDGAMQEGMTLQPLPHWPRSVGRYLALFADPGGFPQLLRPVLLPILAAEPLGLIPSLRHYLRTRQPDGMIVGTTYMNLAAIWSRELAGVPTRLLISERDNLSQNLRTGKVGGSWRWRYLPPVLKRTYPRADAVIGVSEGVTRDLEKIAELPKGLAQTIYNPVVTSDLLAQAANEPGDPWFAPGMPPVILSAGRLVTKKDYPTLLKGFAKLLEDRPAHLIILGKGPDQKRLEQLAVELGIQDEVRFSGWIDNVYAYMARASVFALTSMREGLPGVLIQALACGCPVVSTDCPSGPDEILKGGRLGPLIPMGDDVALTEGLKAMLDHPPSKEILRSRASDFTAEAAVDKYLKALGFAPMPG